MLKMMEMENNFISSDESGSLNSSSKMLTLRAMHMNGNCRILPYWSANGIRRISPL